MIYYFATVIVAFLVASLAGAAVTWDGAYYLYESLDMRQPFTPHSRLFNYVTEFPTVAASWYTNNINLLQALFSVSYALVPIASLIVSWLIVRKTNARDLFVWTVIGTNLALWPGQFSLTTEAVIIIHMTWPLLLIVLLPFQPIYIPVILVFGALIFFAHPSSILLFAMLGGISLLMGLRYRELRRQKLFWFVFFMLLAFVAFLRFQGSETSYETDQLSVQTLSTSFLSAIQGIPLWGIALQIVASLVLLFQRFVRNRKQVAFFSTTLELVLVGSTFSLFLLRASISRLWTGTLDFRTWALISSLPFFAFAVLERMSLPMRLEQVSSLWHHRKRTVQVIGTMFMIIFVAQSVAWYGMQRQLSTTVSAATTPCVSASSISWLQTTPLNHWSVTFYTLMHRGPTPDRFVLGWGNCATEDFSSQNNIAAWALDDESNSQSWFNFAPLESSIARQTQSSACVFAITNGWYWVDQEGTSRWYWMPDQGDINLFLNQSVITYLTGNVLSIPMPNQMNVLIDNKLYNSIAVNKIAAQQFRLQLPTLSPGSHLISIESQKPAVLSTGNNQPTSFGIENLAVQTSAAPCELLP